MTRPSPHRILAACAAILLVVQADWVLTGKRVPEGAILIIMRPGHGLTISDLCGISMLLVSLALWFGIVFAPTTEVTAPAAATAARADASNKRAVAGPAAYAGEGELPRLRRDRP